MFQFTRFAPAYAGAWVLPQAGCPIRESPAKLARQLTEAYRSLAAPFIAR